jgi:multidrug efflux pump subunit AcrA (membrane-fusion protein)
MLIAPTNGQIVSVHSVVGGRIQANQNLITFAPSSGRELRVQVTSEVGLSLSGALAIDLSPDAYLDSKIPLELTRIASIVNKKTGSLDAFFSSDNRLPPVGTVLGVSINLTPQSEVAVIPTDALYGGNLVYRVTETNHLEGIVVNRIGQRPGDGRTEVLVKSNQLKTGDRVLTSRLPAAVTGLKVEVNE